MQENTQLQQGQLGNKIYTIWGSRTQPCWLSPLWEWLAVTQHARLLGRGFHAHVSQCQSKPAADT